MHLKNYGKPVRKQLLTFSLLVFVAGLLPSTINAAGSDYLKRFPDVYKDKVVFVSGEDIWIAPVTGGNATKLTYHDGEEQYPKFSPDGKLIAFTGQYDGNSDVYVMDTEGGNITRLTYHPFTDEVVGWNQTNNKIIFRSQRKSFSRFSNLYMISPDGSGLEEIPMHEIVSGSFSPDGKKIAFNKVSRENRTWKRYKGGTAQEIYIYDFATKNETNITNFRGTDRIPMWIEENIYFLSDRDKLLNIYSYNTVSKKITQLTFTKEYDIRRPSAGKSAIVYEVAGDIYKLDLASGNSTMIPIKINSDTPETRPYIKKVADNITGFDVSPSGKRALITARGEIFSVPKKYGPTINLTNSSGARDKDAVWSPDGKTVAWFSDQDGEYQLYIKDVDGNKAAKKLTAFKDGYRHTIKWSPDSKKIGFTDQKLKLYYVRVSNGELVEVDHAKYENIDVSIDVKPIYDYSWSPDSRYLTYVLINDQQVYQIYIYSLEDKERHLLSEDRYNDFNPIFSKDGNYLFFISNRRFSPTYGDFEWEMVYKKMAGIYSFKLNKSAPDLFPYRNDSENGVKKSKTEKNVELNIDFDGITGRIEAFPLERGNYRNLMANDGGIFYQNKDEGDFNKFEFRRIGPMSLYRFSFNDREEKTVIKDIDAYKLSADGSTIIYTKGKKPGIIESSASDSKGNNIDISDLKMNFDPKAEWTQIFNEAWRMERDYYYEPGMHVLDWPAMRKKYAKMMDKATCRQDVRFIIGELIGELNTSHTYIFGGDKTRKADRVGVGLLGADYQVDKKNNRYRFTKILKEADFNRNLLPPLLRPDIDIKAGDYLLRVNGENVTADKNLYSYFQDLSGKQVSITVGPRASLKGAKTYTVKPVGSEYYLRYLDWVEHNRKLVDKISDGKIGYLHFPDTYNGSAAMFPKYFYSQTRKQGLIVDGRFNGGGLDPEIFLRRLARKPHSYWTRRYSHDQTSPSYGVTAHMVCITNRQAGSGGDELPFEFRQFGMGPIVGTRTWGGLVGVSMFIDLIDGGGLSAPDYRIYTPDGKWVVENEGVEPDVVIDLNPSDMFEGKDAQLQKAVDILQEKIKSEPFTWPQHPAYPTEN